MKISVENFQSLESVEIDATGLTVLVGRSNLGKSALVRALEGALFNRPATGIVRRGATTARVELQDVPAKNGAPLHVVWEKGKGTNRYDVNGEDYTNVGKDAPQPLVDAGYRDLTLDGKDSVRPQIAGQFDPIFMLKLSGTTISEILTRASRLDVLLRAGAACAKDLRSERQLLGLRRADLTKAEVALGEVALPVAELSARVRVLEGQARALNALRDKVDRLRGLVRQQARLRACLVPMPAQVSVAEVAGALERCLTLARRVLPWGKLRTVAGVGLPPESRPYEALARQAQRARDLGHLAPVWRALSVLPAMGPAPVVPDVGGMVERYRALGYGAERMRRLWVVKGLHLPPESPRLGYDKPIAIVEKLRRQVPALEAAVTDLRMAEGAFTSADTEVLEAQSEVSTALADLKVCPVCQQSTVPTDVEELFS